MKIRNNVKLARYTAMYVGGMAKYFAEPATREEILAALDFAKAHAVKVFVLGGGSNTVFSDKGFPGLVLRPMLLGIRTIKETKAYVEIEVGSGVVWDDFVKYAVEHKLYGVENMSHVPGLTGASVVQNVGCYGQETSETVRFVKLLSVATGKALQFTNAEMQFSYRKSRLNHGKDKNQYIVTSIIFRLKKNSSLNLSYGDVKQYFINAPKLTPTLKTLRQAVIQIRDSKFPFPDSPKHGTCGSFFKAKTVSSATYKNIIRLLEKKGLKDKAAYMIRMEASFKVKQGYKVPYGLLIDSLGFKGKQVGGAKILESHADIINNFTGKAKAQDVVKLAEKVKKAVRKAYNVELIVEPELVGFGKF
jgi:UDP-N-acetylmuramate dehydrogenase